MIIIGKWNVPKNLFNEYIKFRAYADAYAQKNPKVMRPFMLEQEIAMRWQSCVQRVMERVRRFFNE